MELKLVGSIDDIEIMLANQSDLLFPCDFTISQTLSGGSP